MVMWSAWPPCRQVWHHVNQSEKSVVFFDSSLLLASGVAVAPVVPIDSRQMAQRGKGLRQLGQQLTCTTATAYVSLNLQTRNKWDIVTIAPRAAVYLRLLWYSTAVHEVLTPWRSTIRYRLATEIAADKDLLLRSREPVGLVSKNIKLCPGNTTKLHTISKQYVNNTVCKMLVRFQRDANLCCHSLQVSSSVR